MPLDVRCAGCGKLLRVADEQAGKALRCPVCNHISTAPAAGAETAFVAAAPPPGWHMRTPEGQTYGPVPREQLDQWLAEGRLSADCMLSQQPGGPWESATAMFPALVPLTPRPVAVQPTFQPASPFGGAVYSPAATATGHYVTPHRGGLILVLGLVGIVVGCPIFSLMAWVMGSGDLREIQAGRMDPSGEGLTRAGWLLGMIPSVICILAAVAVMLFVVVVAVAGR